MMSMRAPALAVLALLAGASACGGPPAVAPTESARTALKERVGPAGTGGPIYCRSDRICGSDVRPEFYRNREFRPAWIDDGLALGDARAFLTALRFVA
ncbi:MAG: hypothetical protein WBC70_02630, partial [Candidatus Aminicenantales bacterium]